ncbi:MAG: hypothetical protein ACRDFS_00295 [Chloroflexota bacterium]
MTEGSDELREDIPPTTEMGPGSKERSIAGLGPDEPKNEGSLPEGGGLGTDTAAGGVKKAPLSGDPDGEDAIAGREDEFRESRNVDAFTGESPPAFNP